MNVLLFFDKNTKQCNNCAVFPYLRAFHQPNSGKFTCNLLQSIDKLIAMVNFNFLFSSGYRNCKFKNYEVKLCKNVNENAKSLKTYKTWA